MTATDLNIVVSTSILTFLGSFLSGIPFLLLGAAWSGLIEEFITPEQVSKTLPRHQTLKLVSGLLLGIVFFVADTGIVPLARRLALKGLSTPATITFVLAGPTINLVVLASMISSFGIGQLLILRFSIVAFTALLVGAVFTFDNGNNDMSGIRLIQPASPSEGLVESLENLRFAERIRRAFLIGGQEFYEFAPWLMLGSLLVVLGRLAIPAATWNDLATNPVGATLLFQLKGFVESPGPSSSGYEAASLVSYLPAGAIISYLTLSSMINLRALPLLLQVFSPKYAAYVVVITVLSTSAACIALGAAVI